MVHQAENMAWSIIHGGSFKIQVSPDQIYNQSLASVQLTVCMPVLKTMARHKNICIPTTTSVSASSKHNAITLHKTNKITSSKRKLFEGNSVLDSFDHQ